MWHTRYNHKYRYVLIAFFFIGMSIQKMLHTLYEYLYNTQGQVNIYT